ncbi:S-layer homology domain-containing protein [Paenibacillus sp. IITD108]|uniref:S-layer homology domain-containing protein n=1 Tax=Paenibacillus sp. IITD108 TaxID=3116649 RepID=UPI002F3FB102
MTKQSISRNRAESKVIKLVRWSGIVLMTLLLSLQGLASEVYGQELKALSSEAGSMNPSNISSEILPVTITPWEQFKQTFGSRKHMVALQTEQMEMDGLEGKWSRFAKIQLPADQKQIELKEWAGAEDLSADVYTAYDDNYFYWAVKVTDNNHTPVSGSTMWRGDSIQFAFSPDGTYGPEYGINYMDGQAHLWQFSEGKAEAGAGQITAAAVQEGDITFYEVRMPWNTIYTEKPEKILPFSLLINDNDGAGRRGWIEWTPGIGKAKSPSSHGKVHLISNDMPWSFWVEGSEELGAGETGEYAVYAVNWGDEEIALNLSSRSMDIGQEINIPAQSAAEVKVDFAPSQATAYELDFTLAEADGIRTLTETINVNVVMTPEALQHKLEAIAEKLPLLEQKLGVVEAQGLSTDYERINYTVIKEFIKYGQDDIVNNRLSRAYYVVEELERLYNEAQSKLQQYLDSSAQPQEVQRYVTGKTDISGYSFMGDTVVRSSGATEKRPIFFTGYGHFGKVREDIPIFQDLGNNIIQIEIGPRDVILDKKDFVNQYTVGRSGNVHASAAAVKGVSHSGESSLQIKNDSPLQPNVYINVSQTIPVEPDTTYEFRVWVKGENAKNTWFPGGAAMKQRKSFPSGTYDWREVVYEYTTGANETSYKLMIVSENTGTIWIDDIQVLKVGSNDNLIKNAGFEESGGYSEDREYVVSTRKIESDIQQVLQRAEEHDVAVSLLISPHYFPAWALDKWPELNVLNNGFIKFSIFHPKAKDIIEDYLRALIPAVATYESLHSITLSNESVYQANKDLYALPFWQEYLKDIYHDNLNELNQIYQSNYSSFEEVPMPANVTANSWSYDYVMFNHDYFARWHEWMIEVIHELASDLPLHAKIMGDPQGSLSWGVDIERFSEFSQINGNDNWNYINEGPKGFIEELSFYDMQTSFKEAPVFNSEHHIIADGDKVYTPEQAKHFRTVLWQSAIHGRSASTIWIWERTYDESSSREGSVLHRPDVVAEAGRTNLDLNRLAWEITAFQNEKPEVALLYNVPAGIFSGDFSNNMLRAYEALSYSGYKTGFISEKQIAAGQLNNYKMLVVPYVTRTEANTLSEIKSFIEQGGRVLLIGTHALKLTPHGAEQAAADRQYILDHADFISAANWTALQMRDFMEPILGSINPQHIKLIDSSNGKMPYHVEWRNTIFEGKTLLNVVNYGSEAVSVQVRSENQIISPVLNLITDEAVHGSTITLEPLTPYLFVLDESENPGNENPGTENPNTGEPSESNPSETAEEEETEGEPQTETEETTQNEVHHPYDRISGVQLNADKNYRYINGYGDGSFRPNRPIKRSEFSQLLFRLVLNEEKNEVFQPLFSDVKSDDWYAQSVGYFGEKGILSGYADNSFRPNKYLTRAEASAILARFVEQSESQPLEGFADTAGHWAESSITLLANQGYLRGYPDHTFRPDAPISRAETVVLLNRLLGRYGQAIDPYEGIRSFTDLKDSYWAYNEIQAAAAPM